MREDFKSTARELADFSLPLIASGVLQQLYNWADAFIVGNVVGEAALAAVGATATAVGFYIYLIAGFSVGLSILFAQTYGSGDMRAMPRILSTFSAVFLAAFSALAALGMATAPALLRLLHTTPDTVAMAEDYLVIVLAGVPFLALYNVYSAALRGLGDSRAPFYAVLVSSAVNVALDLLFVAVFRWSVAGAAAATVASQASMALFLIFYAARRYPVLRFNFSDGLIDRAALAEGCRFGFPPTVQFSVTSLGNLALQNFMNGFGTQTVAAVTTAYRIDTIILLPIINLGSAISTLVAQSRGAGDRERMRRIFSAGAALMAAVSVALTLLVIPTGSRLIALFGAGGEAVAIGHDFFLRIASFYWAFGLATAFRGYIEGLGDVLWSSCAGIAALAFRIAASYALVPFFGNMSIAFAEAFQWLLLLALYAARAAHNKKLIERRGI